MLTSPSQILREGTAGRKNYSPTSVNNSPNDCLCTRELVDHLIGSHPDLRLSQALSHLQRQSIWMLPNLSRLR